MKVLESSIFVIFLFYKHQNVSFTHSGEYLVVTEQTLVVTEQSLVVTEQTLVVTEQTLVVTEQPLVVTEQIFVIKKCLQINSNFQIPSRRTCLLRPK